MSLQYSLKANTVKIPAYQNSYSVFDNTLQEPQVITCVPLLYHILVLGTNFNCIKASKNNGVTYTIIGSEIVKVKGEQILFIHFKS